MRDLILRSCGTLQRAIDYVNSQGPAHVDNKALAKDVDSISTASTIVSLGSILYRILWHAFSCATYGDGGFDDDTNGKKISYPYINIYIYIYISVSGIPLINT